MRWQLHCWKTLHYCKQYKASFCHDMGSHGTLTIFLNLSSWLTSLSFPSACMRKHSFKTSLKITSLCVHIILLTNLAQGTFTIHYLSIYHSRLSISRKFGLIHFFFPFKNNMLWSTCQLTSDFSVKKSSNAMPKHAFVCRKEEEKLINYM